MKKILRKCSFTFLGILVSCGILCTLPSDYFLERYPEYYEIDAVTSATYNIQVTGGKVYDTYAIFETYHKDGYRFHFIGYGIGVIDSVYPDTLMVADTPRVVICTLRNLYPNTTYGYIFRGEWPANAEIENVTVGGVFSTVPRRPGHNEDFNR